MDITQELKEAVERRAKAVERLNQIKADEQETLQEILRLDGEVRGFTRLSKNGDKPKEK
jgi:hypothetical protein